MKEKSKTLKKRKPIVTLSIALLVSSLMLLTACVDSGSTMDNVESSETSQPKSETAKPDTPAQIEWSDSMECSLCHTTQTDSMTDAACQISLNHSGLSCVTCHSEGLSAAHIGITAETKMPRRLKSTEVSSETCLSCHEANYSIEATADKLLTDSVGASVNPHDLPVNDSHTEIVCGSCHSMHSSKTVQETSSAYCLSCHHTETFECGDCHSH